MAISSHPILSAEISALPVYRRSNPLATVVRWELHRLGTARSTWIIAFLVFVLSCLIELALYSNNDRTTVPSDFGPRTFGIDWLSTYGLFHTLPTYLGMLMALFIPFICADGVARDLKRRNDELLMTTAIPSWAYVWGRYLSGLLLSLGLSCSMFLALIVVVVSVHQIQPDLSVAPDLSGITILWAVIFLPPMLLLSSISFALGTLWPRFTTIIKVALLVGWFLDGPIITRLDRGNGLAVWDPTSQAVAQAQTTGTMLNQLVQQTQHQSTQLFLARLYTLEQHLPDMSTWIVPRLVWIMLAIMFVLLATLLFRRFHNVLA